MYSHQISRTMVALEEALRKSLMSGDVTVVRSIFSIQSIDVCVADDGN